MSSLPTLYELRRDYVDALAALTEATDDLPAEAIKDTLDALAHPLREKAVHVAQFMQTLTATAEAIKQAETRMAARRKTLEARTAWLREYLLHNMSVAGITRIDSPWFVLALQKSPPAVEIVDAHALPAELVTVTLEMPRAAFDACRDWLRDVQLVRSTPNKSAIRARLLRGDDVPGACLTQDVQLKVR